MLMNRIQFQPGMSLLEFIQRFGTEAEYMRQGWSGRASRKVFAAATVEVRPTARSRSEPARPSSVMPVIATPR
jgi:hypothetical protein